MLGWGNFPSHLDRFLGEGESRLSDSALRTPCSAPISSLSHPAAPPPRLVAVQEEEADDDDDGVVWMTDTSAEAARKRAEEQLSAATAAMVTVGNIEAEQEEARKKAEREAKKKAEAEEAERKRLEEVSLLQGEGKGCAAGRLWERADAEGQRANRVLPLPRFSRNQHAGSHITDSDGMHSGHL